MQGEEPQTSRSRTRRQKEIEVTLHQAFRYMTDLDAVAKVVILDLVDMGRHHASALYYLVFQAPP